MRSKDTIFDAPARWTLIAVVFLLVYSLALLFYRFNLPTDGWFATEPDSFEVTGFIYHQDILGLPSGLQEGDLVTAVNGFPLFTDSLIAPAALVEAWRAGNTVQYTVERVDAAHRDNQTFILDVPLTRWPVQRYLADVVLAAPEQLLWLAGVLFFFLVSLYAFLRRPDLPAARSLVFLAALIVCSIILVDLLPQMAPDRIDPLAGLGTLLIITAMFTVLLPPTFIRLALVFPRPKPLLARAPWVAYLPFLIGGLVVLAFIRQQYIFGWIWTGAAVLISVLILLHNAFTMRDVTSRGQMRWALGGAILGLALFGLTYINVFFVESSASPMGQLLSALSGLSFTVMGISLAVAVLRYHLFDIDVVVNRTLVYGGLTLSVIAIYILVTGYLSYLFQTEANLAISLVATGVVAVSFGHLRGWLQRGVNRLMYGQRDEPYQVLTHLGEELQTTVDPAQTLQTTVATIAQSLKLPFVAIHLRRNGQRRVAAAYGLATQETEHFPLFHGGEEVGELEAAPRAANDPLSTADRQLLNDLARQIGPTAGASLLALDLEEARLRIVTASEESRRQLGSDLHDGVGHQLAGLTRKAEYAQTMLARNPDAVQETLAHMGRQVEDTSTEVRELSHQLHPPELALLGLAGALQERAEAVTAFTTRLHVAGDLPPLSAAVETAAYSIILEALRNIEEEAQAQNCLIRLGLNGEDSSLMTRGLKLHIEDDGRGWRSRNESRSGQLAIQGRAAEVGGVCTIEAAQDGGMRVVAHLPLPREDI